LQVVLVVAQVNFKAQPQVVVLVVTVLLLGFL
jgi:hypothetical protein